MPGARDEPSAAAIVFVARASAPFSILKKHGIQQVQRPQKREAFGSAPRSSAASDLHPMQPQASGMPLFPNCKQPVVALLPV
jgi:hypothetical protein